MEAESKELSAKVDSVPTPISPEEPTVNVIYLYKLGRSTIQAT